MAKAKRKIEVKPDPMEHARSNAASWYEHISELVAALEFFNGEGAERLEELEEERGDLDLEACAVDCDDPETARATLVAWDKDHGEELAELRAAKGEFDDADDVQQRISERPLSVEVRSDWHEIGGDAAPAEFRILLTTGGPALQIRGDLSEHGNPTRAYLQMQDWGTPWADYFGSGDNKVSGDVLLTYCQQFYFGEGQ